ncbi:hypothetical protein D3C81_1090120 [compost metagenome]
MLGGCQAELGAGLQVQQAGEGVDRHVGEFLRKTGRGVDRDRLDFYQGDELGAGRNGRQGDGAVLEFRLQRNGVDGVAGHGVDRQVVAIQVIPVEGGEAVARPHAVADHCRQHRAATARAHFHLALVGDAETVGIQRVDLQEGAGVELVQGGHLAGLGQGVPLVLHPTGIEHQGEGVVGHLRRVHVRAGEEPRLAVGRGKGKARLSAVFGATQVLADAIVQVAQRMTVGAIILRAGPLQRGFAQARMAGAAQVVAGVRVPEALDLLEHLVGRGIVEGIGIAHGAGHAGDDPPVGHGLAGRGDGLLHQSEVALGIDHHAFRLGPQRAGQEDVGVAVGLGIEEGVLGDDQLGGLQALDHAGAVGDAGDRVGADDPAGLHLAGAHVVEQRDGAAAGLAAQGSARDAPDVLDEVAVFLDERAALSRQARAHVAHLPATHGVRLAGKGERPAAGAADFPGGQVQVADGVGVPGAVGALVEAHGPAAHPFASLADPLRGLADGGFFEASERRDVLGGVFGEEGRHLLPAFGEFGDERFIAMAIGP